mgnify:CR=1 FL=1
MIADPSGDEISPGTDPPTWLELAPAESVLWRGTRRVWVLLPTALGVFPFVLAGIGVTILLPATDLSPVIDVVGLLISLGALGILAWRYLAVRNTVYVATDEHLYRKQGVLSRSVTTVDYETVQNVTYSQSITGRLFDHGSLSFDTAGGSGTELSFQDIDDPRPVESLVNERMARARGQSDEETVPGTTQQWEAVLEEVRGIRQSLDA